MKRNRLIFFLVLIIMSIIQGPALGKDFYDRTILIGGDNNYPPYEFMDNDNFRGFNVDIIRAIAIELGLEIKLVPSSWENTMEDLKNGDLDAVQGMTITPDREKFYDFTDEIVMNSQNIFVLASTENISDIGDLRGKTVAIQAEDVTQEILAHLEGINIVEKINQQEALEALITEEVDAYVGNRLTGIYYVQSFGLTESVKIVGDSLYSTKYSIAVKNSDEGLLRLLNSGLRSIKDKGTYDKIYKKWFGETIVSINEKLKNLLYISLVALFLSIILISIIYYWNTSLKKEVDIRTREILELNTIAMHNDKMQALGELSAGIAHELRNPLTSIKTFIDLLPGKYENKEFREELTKIVPKEINRLNDLVSSLLDYAKPKNPNPKTLYLDSLLEDVLTLLKQKIYEREIKVIKNNTDLSFYADESQMKQVLINIILNSIDAIKDKGLIEIEGRKFRNNVLISIKDNGIGIAKEVQNKLFDPFFSSKKTSYGIGLSVTHRLINENRGEIKVESEINLGTTIIINMPKTPALKEDENA